jgi:hypothetical protein
MRRRRAEAVADAEAEAVADAEAEAVADAEADTDTGAVTGSQFVLVALLLRLRRLHDAA